KALSTSLSNHTVGLLVAVPYIFAFITMFLVGRSSDRSGERRWHTIFGMIMGAIGLGGSVLFANISIFVSMMFFTLSVMGIYASFGPFWSIPHSFLTTRAAAGAIAMINSIGNLGGFVGPYAMGYIRDATGSFNGGLLFLVGCLLAASVCLILLRKSG
ncbi:MAG TPA: MFS transporter, partial [Syntrophales bacterium]|nr:MFS transporter [Syntrophales bacterium]